MSILHWILIVLHFVVALPAVGHALLFKRDSRAALGWIAVCILFPLLGPALYFLFGINRIQTRARKLHGLFPLRFGFAPEDTAADTEPVLPALGFSAEFSEIVKISQAVSRRPIVGGNSVELLCNGEEAYPAMLAAIDRAQTSLYMATYLFETNRSGRQFIQALARAAGRGVDVRVIVDGIGELYSIPRAGSLLAKRGVPVTRFLPPKIYPPAVHINLRNHRKMLVADGKIAFAGGMNIGDRHLVDVPDNGRRVKDVHFRLTGPVVTQIENAFLEDWAFCTGAPAPARPAPVAATGPTLCRAIVDGPNENHGKLATILFGAIATARRRIAIMTPYFLPSRELVTALQNAALRGVEVEILLPARSNLPFVQWATAKMLWELLQKGVRIFYQPPPFTHSKLLVVDDHYGQIGSANIDPRSLRLNFELAVEIYGDTVAEVLAPHFAKSLKGSREISLKEIDSRSVPVRIRDALAWLFSPYL